MTSWFDEATTPTNTYTYSYSRTYATWAQPTPLVELTPYELLAYTPDGGAFYYRYLDAVGYMNQVENRYVTARRAEKALRDGDYVGSDLRFVDLNAMKQYVRGMGAKEGKQDK